MQSDRSIVGTAALLAAGLLLVPGCPRTAAPPPRPAPAATSATLDSRPDFKVPVTVLVYRVRSGLAHNMERQVSKRLEAAGVAVLRIDGRAGAGGDELAVVVNRKDAPRARGALPQTVELSLQPLDETSDYLAGVTPPAPLTLGKGAPGQAPHLLGTRAVEARLSELVRGAHPPQGKAVVLGYLGSPIASDEKDGVRSYLVEAPLASGDRLSDVTIATDKATRRPVVSATFEAPARTALAAHVAANPKARVAVVLDGRVLAVLSAAELSGQGPVPLAAGEPDDPHDLLLPLLQRIKRAAEPSVLVFLRSVEPPAPAGSR
jgi:hypothetical protein